MSGLEETLLLVSVVSFASGVLCTLLVVYGVWAWKKETAK